MTKKEFCSVMDHSCLGWFCPREMVEQYCSDATEFGFASVCVNPDNVALCAKLLAGRAGISCVVGFPCGANTTEIKIAEGLRAIEDGATDLDFVTNLSLLRGGRDEELLAEYKAFVAAVRTKKPDVIVKIIMYAPFGANPCLTEDETRRVAELIIRSGADYIKFCCDPAIIKAIVGDRIKMKFSGAATFELAVDGINKGCARIGEDDAAKWLRANPNAFAE